MSNDRERAPSGPEGSRTVERALQLLELLEPGQAVGGLTVSELAELMGVGRPVVYRLVRSLESHRFVARNDKGRYRLGLGLYRLSEAAGDSLVEVALPVLRNLADEVGATAHLTVVRGVEAVALAVVEPSWTTMHVSYRVGSRHALARGAAGRAILAGREGDWSWVATTGELQTGAHGLAAPVPGVADLEASVGVVSLGGLDVSTVGPQVRAAAESVGRELTRNRGTGK